MRSRSRRCWRRRSRRSRRDYTHVFGPSTTFGKDLMPRVAALLGVGQVSDVMAVGARLQVPASDLRRQRDHHRRSAAGQEGRRDRAHRFVPGRAAGGSAAVEAANVDAALPDAHPLRRALRRRRPIARTCRRPPASSPAAAPSAARRTSRSSTASPTSSAPPSAPRAPRWTPATLRTNCRSARPARSSRRSCTSPSAFPARSST